MDRPSAIFKGLPEAGKGVRRLFRQSGNKFSFFDSVSGDPLPIIAALHAVINKKGYQDVELNFSDAEFVAAPFMLPLLITCRKYQASGIDFSMTLPSQPDGARLMQNTDWAHLIEPTKYESMVGANFRNMSATTFEGAREAHDAVDFAVRLIMRSISGLDRKRISAIEWSIAEIVDNVLNHSESPVGGIIQVMAYPRKRRIEIFVCDAGLTIPKTLRQFGRSYEDDIFALEDAIKEGVTKNEKTNKGNGLFGTFRCCEVSGGEFDIISGNCSLRYRSGSRYEAAYTNLRSSKIPFGGTYVRASINVDYQRLLENALIFKGIAHTPSFDIIEKRYETDDDSVIFRASEESSSFSTRDSGRQARILATNLMSNFSVPITFDFSDVSVISSSYADEVFGKLLLEMGENNFQKLCRFSNLDTTVKLLVDRAVRQRLSEARGDVKV